MTSTAIVLVLLGLPFGGCLAVLYVDPSASEPLSVQYPESLPSGTITLAASLVVIIDVICVGIALLSPEEPNAFVVGAAVATLLFFIYPIGSFLSGPRRLYGVVSLLVSATALTVVYALKLQYWPVPISLLFVGLVCIYPIIHGARSRMSEDWHKLRAAQQRARHADELLEYKKRVKAEEQEREQRRVQLERQTIEFRESQIELIRLAASNTPTPDLIKQADEILIRLYQKSTGLISVGTAIVDLRLPHEGLPALMVKLRGLRDRGLVRFARAAHHSDYDRRSSRDWDHPDTPKNSEIIVWPEILQLTEEGLSQASAMFQRESSINIGRFDVTTGDNFYVGSGSVVINRSRLNNSLNKMREKEEGADSVDALQRVAAAVEQSENPDAVELFDSFTAELQQAEPKKSVLRTLFAGLNTAVPALAQMADVAVKLAPLFQ